MSDSWLCSLCPKEFPTKPELIAHLNLIHAVVLKENEEGKYQVSIDVSSYMNLKGKN